MGGISAFGDVGRAGIVNYGAPGASRPTKYQNNSAMRARGWVGNMPLRKQITKQEQLKVWEHDKWCCRYCGRPVIFAPAMKQLEKISPAHGYYHAHWKRQHSPLLDEIGATVDHIKAVKTGVINSHDNYNTSCWKCNLSKNDKPLEGWGKILENLPTDWDGLSSLFVELYDPITADSTDKQWYRLLMKKSEDR